VIATHRLNVVQSEFLELRDIDHAVEPVFINPVQRRAECKCVCPSSGFAKISATPYLHQQVGQGCFSLHPTGRVTRVFSGRSNSIVRESLHRTSGTVAVLA
jgi:hypothetical protein